MDWAKAKTILIIVLLSLCIILCGMLLIENIKEWHSADVNRKATIEYLESRGIKVNADIPKKRAKMEVLFVKFDEESKDNTELEYEKYHVYTNTGSSDGYSLTSIGESKAKVIAASDALLSVPSRMGTEDGLEINAIELCYYIDDNMLSLITGSSDTAVPAWKIETSSGTCYILAY